MTHGAGISCPHTGTFMTGKSLVNTLALRPSRATAALSGALMAMALTACMTAGADDQERGGGDQTPTSAASISIRAAGADSWDPSRPLVITASAGQLTHVQVRDRVGHKVAGNVMRHGTVWRSDSVPLEYDMAYTVQARAVDVVGLATRKSARFRTADPKNLVYSSITPFSRQVVGVGMPIIVTFDEPVPNRAAAERQLSVKTSPVTLGSWHWANDQMVRWRPKEYWRAGTDVVVRSQLVGVNLGNGTWGNDDDRVKFSVGSRLVSTVNIAKHKMVVVRGNEVLRTVPVTTGKIGWDTRNGIKVIMSKERNVVMDAATLDVDSGDPEYYRLDVEYAMRLRGAASTSMRHRGRSCHKGRRTSATVARASANPTQRGSTTSPRPVTLFATSAAIARWSRGTVTPTGP